MYTRQLLTSRLTKKESLTSCYYSTRGALGGGFNEEDLRRWFIQETSNIGNEQRRNRTRRINSVINETTNSNDEVFADMFSHRVSPTCATWLDGRPHPSSEMARAYFGSSRFAPEHVIMRPFFSQHSSLPPKFEINTKFMVWDTKVVSPYELICTWRMPSSSIHGCTMVGFDPMSRKVYHGNCLSTEWISSARFLLPLHEKYAQFLMHGMVNHLEKLSTHKN
mmetsp:Transcript_13823/g.16709  ORF Transcript_13823/g.16709 Transcript_13823/m.16709 type:complete len:222 (+) Transcript_13823:14-679(+)